MPQSPIRIAVFCAYVFTASLSFASSVVTRWNDAALEAIRTGKTAPPVASRNLAILHTAIYDAVNGISRTHESYLVESAVAASASREAAASAAGYTALRALFPASAGRLAAIHESIIAEIPEKPQKQAGLHWGQAVAEAVLASRAFDGANGSVPGPIGSDPWSWVPTPPAFAPYALPHWGFVTPFGLTSPSQFRPPGPPSLDSAQWAEECNEVKAWGRATGSLRTPEHDLIALFWADGAGTETPPGHWNSIAQDISEQLGHSMEQDARLFALLNIALADAAICAWDAKYTFNFWRPVTALRNADMDGNDGTEPDPEWSSFIGTPPFPDYVSGHSTFSGAASAVLALFCGRDDIAFTTGSDFLPGVLRTFAGFSAAAEEAALSRLYGGIHFRSANEDGLTAGLQIGEWTYTRLLQPKGNRSRSNR